MFTRTLKRLLLAVSMCCLVATANAEPMDDAIDAYSRGDYAQALKIFRQLAAQGDASAQVNVGSMYELGRGAARDFVEAEKWYRLAEKSGSLSSKLSLMRLEMLAAAQKNTAEQPKYTDADISVANFAYDRGDYAQAFELYRLLATSGDAIARTKLGWMYAVGNGVTKNCNEALRLYFQAIYRHPDQENIGNEIIDPMTRISTKERMFRTAHSGGVSEEGVSQEIGVSFSGKDRKVSFGSLDGVSYVCDSQYLIDSKWHDVAPLINLGMAAAVENKVTESQPKESRQSTSIKTGMQQEEQVSIKTTRKTEQSTRTYKRLKPLAERGNADAQYDLGVLYFTGTGVTENTHEALKWFRLAAQQGHIEASRYLEDPELIGAAQQFQQPKANQRTNQPRRTVNRTETPERATPPKLVFNASTPKSDGTVELSGRVISDARISEISINGRALEVSLGRDNSFKVTRLPPMGVVTSYRLSVSDEYGQKTETEIHVERAAVQYAEQVAPLNPRKLKAKTNPNAVALIIGIEAYSRLPQAQYADSDATHFYDYANQSLGVPPHKIKLLTDTKASRTNLLLAMRSWMRTEVNGKSDVYIFFAGHGLASADGSKTYLLPEDGERDLLDETSILRDDLIASAKGAKTITLFLDTCYSGGTRTNEILLADARPIAIVPDKSALPSNVTVLAAASGAQLSSTYEAAQQGLFSYWLMKGLEGDADTNKDKKITTGELHEYVAKQVGPMAQRRNRQQDPQLMGDSTRVLVSY